MCEGSHEAGYILTLQSYLRQLLTLLVSIHLCSLFNMLITDSGLKTAADNDRLSSALNYR